jgi:hypothetical protein
MTPQDQELVDQWQANKDKPPHLRLVEQPDPFDYELELVAYHMSLRDDEQ